MICGWATVRLVHRGLPWYTCTDMIVKHEIFDVGLMQHKWLYYVSNQDVRPCASFVCQAIWLPFHYLLSVMKVKVAVSHVSQL